MQKEQGFIAELKKFTVAIRDAETNKIRGTGVIVTDEGVIMTCYHVIGNLKNKSITHKITNVYFPIEGVTKSAETLEEYCDASLDVAFLKLEGPLPAGNNAANLSEIVNSGNDFGSLGFVPYQVIEYSPLYGKIAGFNRKTDDSSSAILLIPEDYDPVAGGMSGAPVLDRSTNCVIGIISDHFPTKNPMYPDPRPSLAIPIEEIAKSPITSSAINKNLGLQKSLQPYQNIKKYIDFIIEENDSSNEVLSSLKGSHQRSKKLHEYYVEQDAFLVAKDGIREWTSEDKDIIHRQARKSGNGREKAKKIIENALLKQGELFYLLVGAPFGGGTSTLAKWLAYCYASDYAKSFWDNELKGNDRLSTVHNENELNCIPIIISLRKGSSLKSQIYLQKTLDDLLEEIIAPSLAEFKPAKILLILDELDQLDSDQIMELKEKISKYHKDYPLLKILLLSKLKAVPKEASDLIDRFARLLPFNHQQAKEYFWKAGGLQESHYNEIRQSYGVELVTYPLFAWMVCLIHARDAAANRPVLQLKDERSLMKRIALVYTYFLAQISELKFGEITDVENKDRRKWFEVIRTIAAFNHIYKNKNIQSKQILEMLREEGLHNSEDIPLDYHALEPIIVKTKDGSVKFVHESFREYLLATFYIQSLLLHGQQENGTDDNDDSLTYGSKTNIGDANRKRKNLCQYNLNIGISDTSQPIDFLEGLLEILLDEQNTEKLVYEHKFDLRDCLGYDRTDRLEIKTQLEKNTLDILKHHYLVVSDVKDALGHNEWVKRWYDNEIDTIEKSELVKSFQIGNLWIHLWISLFVLNKLNPGLKVSGIKNLDQLMVLSSNRIPPELKRMKGIDLSNTELSGIDLHHADLSYTIIEEAKLRSANLWEARLIEANLRHSDLSNAKLFNASMYGADLSFATLLRADLSGIKLTPVDEESQEEYKIANFSNTNLGDANISDAKMHGVDLTDADLYRVNLCDTDLSAATLRRTKLTFANLSYANLREATIDKPNLAYANLSEANLVGADFSSCFFEDQSSNNFANVNLSGARIYQAKPVDKLLKCKNSSPLHEQLVKTFPKEKEEEVPVSTHIIACFSDSIEKLATDGTYSFRLSKSIVFDDTTQQIKTINEPYVKGRRTDSKDSETIVFKPSCPLEYSSKYGVVIEDFAGIPLAKWWFTTAPSSNATHAGIITAISEKEIANVKVLGGKSHDGNLYDRTLDDDLNTRWSNYGKDSWIRFDLGSERNICAMDIGWFKGDKRIYDFQISYSISDNNEKDYHQVDPSSFRSSGKTLSPERYTFLKVKARYVKIIVNGNSQNNWASISQVAFFECADSS